MATFSFKSGLLLLGLLALLSGCRYYKPVTEKAVTPADKAGVINKYRDGYKYFILRHAAGNYALFDITIDQKAQTLNATLRPLPDEHRLYINSTGKNYQLPKAGSQAVLDEVHIYAAGRGTLDTATTATFALDSIQKIEVIQFDKSRTTTSYVLGIAIPVAAAVGIIAIASSGGDDDQPVSNDGQGSCPYISVFDGESYVVQGEAFGGAIYPSLEREDFMPLKAEPVNGVYQIRISNELREVQHTNSVKLMVIRHDRNVKALTDEKGNIYTLSTTQPPTKATLNSQQDVITELAQIDRYYCSFNDTASDHINSLVLHFNKPTTARDARLLLHVKNSSWLEGMYADFTEAFGGYYEEWSQKQRNLTTQGLEKQFQNQHIPLTVSIRTPEGWKEVSHLKNIGPLAFREVVVPLDLSKVNGSQVEVKLSTGFMFWDLDYVGIDYSAQDRFTVQALSPFSATDEKDRDVLPALMHRDRLYLDQPQPGNAAVLKFMAGQPVAAGQAITVVLNTSGYYEPVRHYKGLPDLSLLKKVRQPGGLSAFSRQQYAIYQRTDRTLAITQ